MVATVSMRALIKFVTQLELPLTWGIYAPKVSIPVEGKVPLGDAPKVSIPLAGKVPSGDKGASPPCSMTPYFAFMNATVVSSMRLLKPHSLSYQAEAFTSVPFDTLVSVASKMLECGLWLKSTDTSGSVL